MRIVHIAEAIERLETHAGGLAECELHEDVLRYYGIVKNIEIIGEAARMLNKYYGFRTDIQKHRQHPAYRRGVQERARLYRTEIVDSIPQISKICVGGVTI